MDEEEGEAGGVVEGEGGSDPFGEVEEFGCGYADGEGGELVEDGPDDDWDVAEGLELVVSMRCIGGLLMVFDENESGIFVMLSMID